MLAPHKSMPGPVNHRQMAANTQMRYTGPDKQTDTLHWQADNIVDRKDSEEVK